MDAKSLREAMKEKAKRLSGATSEKVDASTFTPAEPLNADVKTGARPISRRAFKVGGKVAGVEAMTHAGRTPRKSGGKTEYANALVNRNVKDANEEREGKKHIGAFKSGGRIAKMGGGLADLKKRRMTDDGYENDPYRRIYSDEENPMRPSKERIAEGNALMQEEQRRVGDMTRRKDGGKAEKFEGSAKDQMQDKKLAAKRGMSMKEWEASKADDKHDKQESMKGLKSGGRTAKMGGGSMGMIADAAGKMKDPNKAMMGGLLAGGMKSGGKAMHHKDCMCKACGGSAGYKDGGKTEKNDSTYGVRTPMRLKKTVTGSNPEKSAKIYKDQDFGEYRVKHYEGGKHNEAADYHTDDMDDAHATASDFVNKKRGGSAMKRGGGLYANINAKRKRGEKMREPGEKGAPTAKAFEDAARTARASGGKAMHHKDCMCKACGGATMDGGRMARKSGGKVGKSNISINIFPHNAEKAGAMPVPPAGMPPMPPMGGGAMPPPMMKPPMPAPSPMPSAPPPAHMSLPPGLMAAMSGAANAGPMPPAGGPMPPPMMGRKAGGKVVYPITGGAGGGRARKEKVEVYGEKMNKDLKK